MSDYTNTNTNTTSHHCSHEIDEVEGIRSSCRSEMSSTLKHSPHPPQLTYDSRHVLAGPNLLLFSGDFWKL